MGTDGMSYSLQSRDLIADSIETVMAAQWYDANYWTNIHGHVDEMDTLIDQFNERTGLLAEML